MTTSPKKLKILIFGTGFYRVGDYFRYRGFAETLSEFGHKVTLVLNDQKLRFTSFHETVGNLELVYPPYWGGLKIIEKLSPYLHETKLPYDVLYRVIFSLLYGGGYDVLHGFHIGFNTFLPLMAARKPNHLPVLVYDWCDLWDEGLISPPRTGLLHKIDYHFSVSIEHVFHRFVDGVTVNSHFLADRLLNCGITQDKLLIVREGAYTEQVRPIPQDLARDKLGITRNIFLVGFAGFFNPHDLMLIKTFALLRAMGKNDINLLSIGPTGATYSELIKQNALNDMIKNIGPIQHERIGEYLSACDVLILPFSEANFDLARWPMKLGDYLAVGKPVIAGANGEVRNFFIKYPDIGILCSNTPESFVQAILELRHDPARIEHLSACAREVAVTTLNWTKAARNLENFYYRLLEEKKQKIRANRC